VKVDLRERSVEHHEDAARAGNPEKRRKKQKKAVKRLMINYKCNSA